MIQCTPLKILLNQENSVRAPTEYFSLHRKDENSYQIILNWDILLSDITKGDKIDIRNDITRLRATLHQYNKENPKKNSEELHEELLYIPTQVIIAILPPEPFSSQDVKLFIDRISKFLCALIRNQILGISLNNFTCLIFEFYVKNNFAFSRNEKSDFRTQLYMSYTCLMQNNPELKHIYLLLAILSNDLLLVDLLKTAIKVKKVDYHGKTIWSIAATRSACYKYKYIENTSTTIKFEIPPKHSQQLLKIFHSFNPKGIDCNNDSEEIDFVSSAMTHMNSFVYETALSAAIFHGEFDNAKVLLNLGANINAIVNERSQFTALHSAMMAWSLLTTEEQELDPLINQLLSAYISSEYLNGLNKEINGISIDKKKLFVDKFGLFIQALLFFGANQEIKDKKNCVARDYLTTSASIKLNQFEETNATKIESIPVTIIAKKPKGFPTPFWLRAREIGNARTKFTISQKLQFKF